MRTELPIRAATAALLGEMFGLYIHSYRMKWSRLGEDAYLDHESLIFSRSIAHPRMFLTFVEVILMALVVAALYELIVAVLSKLTNTSRQN